MFDGCGDGRWQGNGKATAAKMDLDGGRWHLTATMDDGDGAVVEN